MRAFSRRCISPHERCRARTTRTTLLAATLPSGDVREFPARFVAVTDTANFTLAFCERNGIARQSALRLRLIVEELLTNSIQHGYRAESDTPIRIELAVIEGYPTLKYEDSAPPYDPLTRVSALASRDITLPRLASGRRPRHLPDRQSCLRRALCVRRRSQSAVAGHADPTSRRSDATHTARRSRRRADRDRVKVIADGVEAAPIRLR